MTEDIDEIRRKTIAEIKEKVKKNLKYLHPANKEYQEDMERLKFANGNDFTYWMQQNRIMKNPWNLNREHRQNTIENAGCKTWKEYLDKRVQNVELKDENIKPKDEIENIKEKKYEKGTLGWLRQRQKIEAKKDGFDNIDDWLEWKNRDVEEKYGKEFADWTRENKGKVPDKWINAGCKTLKEYQDNLAKKAGFKDSNERIREWLHRTGRNLPKEFNEYCSVYFGEFTENVMIQTFEDAMKMPYGNPGFDWTCKRGDKIDNKGCCLYYIKGKSPIWKFQIKWNDIADWFILSAWDNRDSLNPLHVWIFHKNDIVRGIEFWRRRTLTITNTPEGLKEFEKYEVTDRLEKLKELIKKLKAIGEL